MCCQTEAQLYHHTLLLPPLGLPWGQLPCPRDQNRESNSDDLNPSDLKEAVQTAVTRRAPCGTQQTPCFHLLPSPHCWGSMPTSAKPHESPHRSPVYLGRLVCPNLAPLSSPTRLEHSTPESRALDPLQPTLKHYFKISVSSRWLATWYHSVGLVIEDIH